jgi:hypothetical protein
MRYTVTTFKVRREKSAYLRHLRIFCPDDHLAMSNDRGPQQIPTVVGVPLAENTLQRP